ncbi:MAG: hypothetical protein OEY38_12865 [Gammaproteobacteria bacterium]|nr:hypothetical protein [Gammaproteobacteria bacterium]
MHILIILLLFSLLLSSCSLPGGDKESTYQYFDLSGQDYIEFSLNEGEIQKFAFLDEKTIESALDNSYSSEDLTLRAYIHKQSKQATELQYVVEIENHSIDEFPFQNLTLTLGTSAGLNRAVLKQASKTFPNSDNQLVFLNSENNNWRSRKNQLRISKFDNKINKFEIEFDLDLCRATAIEAGICENKANRTSIKGHIQVKLTPPPPSVEDRIRPYFVNQGSVASPVELNDSNELLSVGQGISYYQTNLIVGRQYWIHATDISNYGSQHFRLRITSSSSASAICEIYYLQQVNQREHCIFTAKYPTLYVQASATRDKNPIHGKRFRLNFIDLSPRFFETVTLNEPGLIHHAQTTAIPKDIDSEQKFSMYSLKTIPGSSYELRIENIQNPLDAVAIFDSPRDCLNNPGKLNFSATVGCIRNTNYFFHSAHLLGSFKFIASGEQVQIVTANAQHQIPYSTSYDISYVEVDAESEGTQTMPKRLGFTPIENYQGLVAKSIFNSENYPYPIEKFSFYTAKVNIKQSYLISFDAENSEVKRLTAEVFDNPNFEGVPLAFCSLSGDEPLCDFISNQEDVLIKISTTSAVQAINAAESFKLSIIPGGSAPSIEGSKQAPKLIDLDFTNSYTALIGKQRPVYQFPTVPDEYYTLNIESKKSDLYLDAVIYDENGYGSRAEYQCALKIVRPGKSQCSFLASQSPTMVSVSLNSYNTNIHNGTETTLSLSPLAETLYKNEPNIELGLAPLSYVGQVGNESSSYWLDVESGQQYEISLSNLKQSVNLVVSDDEKHSPNNCKNDTYSSNQGITKRTCTLSIAADQSRLYVQVFSHLWANPNHELWTSSSYGTDYLLRVRKLGEEE